MQEQNEQTESRWQKIGTQGEVLAIDAKKWVAVIDNKTEMMWAINPSKTADFPNPKKMLKWSDARAWVDYVNTQGWCGFNDWRLPTLKELKTLITKNKQPNLFIREDIFNDINIESCCVWSSSPFTRLSYHWWVVHFGDGDSNCKIKYNRNNVRLMRSSR